MQYWKFHQFLHVINRAPNSSNKLNWIRRPLRNWNNIFLERFKHLNLKYVQYINRKSNGRIETISYAYFLNTKMFAIVLTSTLQTHTVFTVCRHQSQLRHLVLRWLANVYIVRMESHNGDEGERKEKKKTKNSFNGFCCLLSTTIKYNNLFIFLCGFR